MHPNTHTKSQSMLNETMSAWASSGVKSASDQHKTPSLIMASSYFIAVRSIPYPCPVSTSSLHIIILPLLLVLPLLLLLITMFYFSDECWTDRHRHEGNDSASAST